MAAALREAKAHREKLVRKGLLKPPEALKPKQAKHSTVRGVYFSNGRQKWRTKLADPYTKKLTDGGGFVTQEEAESKARELAKELGNQGYRAQGGPGEASLGAEALRAAGPPAGSEVEPRRAVLARDIPNGRQATVQAVQAQGLLGEGGEEGMEAGGYLAQAARGGPKSGEEALRRTTWYLRLQ